MLLVDLFRDVAAFVDQVARGAKAGDVPMRAPPHFHTAFNLKTAKALGLHIINDQIAGAETVFMVGRNRSNAVMRGIVVPPGSKNTSRAKGSRRNLGDPASGRQQVSGRSASGR